MTNNLLVIWTLFIIAIFAFVLRIALSSIGLDITHISLYSTVIVIIPICMLITHSIMLLTKRRATLFIITAMLIGFVFEYLGLNYGVVFGGSYIYQKSTFMIADMPVAVPFFWAVFIYMGYSMSNNLLFFTHLQKPDHSKDPYLSVLVLSILDALAIVAIDLLLDPVQVAKGSWSWLDGGAYFGIPIGNFWGWFMVGFIVSALYRTFEYHRPQKFPLSGNKFVYLMPMIGYLLITISLLIDPSLSNNPEIRMIGLLATMPFVVCNLLFYVLNTKSSH